MPSSETEDSPPLHPKLVHNKAANQRDRQHKNQRASQLREISQGHCPATHMLRLLGETGDGIWQHSVSCQWNYFPMGASSTYIECWMNLHAFLCILILPFPIQLEVQKQALISFTLRNPTWQHILTLILPQPPHGGDSVSESKGGGVLPAPPPLAHSLPRWSFKGGEKHVGWATNCNLSFPLAVPGRDSKGDHQSLQPTLSWDFPITQFLIQMWNSLGVMPLHPEIDTAVSGVESGKHHEVQLWSRR